MWQHCSLSAAQRQTAPIAEGRQHTLFRTELIYPVLPHMEMNMIELWWPEFDMFGSPPWCSFPWHKLLTRLTPKNWFTVYRLNLIHEFTSFFSTKVTFVGMPKKTFPRKQAFVDRKQGPRFSQGQPKWAEPIARMTVVWKVEKAERAEFNVPTCGNIAVCQQCRDRR